MSSSGIKARLVEVGADVVKLGYNNNKQTKKLEIGEKYILQKQPTTQKRNANAHSRVERTSLRSKCTDFGRKSENFRGYLQNRSCQLNETKKGPRTERWEEVNIMHTKNVKVRHRAKILKRQRAPYGPAGKKTPMIKGKKPAVSDTAAVKTLQFGKEKQEKIKTSFKSNE